MKTQQKGDRGENEGYTRPQNVALGEKILNRGKGMISTISVVVTYNRKQLLSECLEALINQSAPCDILIIDNASTDGTDIYVKELAASKSHSSRQIFYHNTGSNIGGAGGFSLGVKMGYQKGYEYLWLMDDDCIPRHDALEVLLKMAAIHENQFGFLAGKILYDDGTPCTINLPRQGVFRKKYFLEEKAYRCDLACFTSVLFPRWVVEDVGLPIGDFFIWSDDWEYTRRISQKYSCYACMESIAVHKPKTKNSCSIVAEDGERLSRYRYIYRNDVYLYKREGLLGFLYVMARGLWHVFNIVLRSPHRKLEKCKIVIGATWKGFFFRPGIEMVEGK